MASEAHTERVTSLSHAIMPLIYLCRVSYPIRVVETVPDQAYCLFKQYVL